MTVSRPTAGVVVVAHGRAGAAVRLAIWLAVVGAFYLALAAGGSFPGGDGPAGGHRAADPGAGWLLLLVPLALAPYLVDGLRVLVRGRACTFDGGARELRASGRAPVPFARIRAVEVGAVNATCEEATVSVVLDDGSAVAVATGARFAAMRALAGEIAARVGAPLSVAGGGAARLIES